ncbi:PHA/PHB synthase family protein [Lutimaribacter saemankumensis]|uniref:Polyhydroxyalkanoate synthase n=1 Tax=Lutimaribacter saemankumensis TaxID=490829 RepID=A0A1G8TRH6_9RHOB|nr:alpha/beta fold hydrolase [Lutimaribacter saemankumensis]SDJ44186.1 polyhydroxyalkanoate synthase [Lutimaribacter saemankumensis]
MAKPKKPEKPAIRLVDQPDADPQPKAPDMPVPSDFGQRADTHPYQDLDKMVRAVIARYSGGVSPYSVFQAWSDWAMHLSRAPGRRIELAELAARNAVKLGDFAAKTAMGQDPKPPFQPKKTDHRFNNDAWSDMPFAFWQQSFLATQDWWDHATDAIRGLSPPDSERVRFMMRQALDLISPSNFPATNPEIVNETIRQRGRNIVDGFEHFIDDLMHTLTQAAQDAPEGFQIGKDIACTPGKVVYRRELFELIQYAPNTEKVHAEPVLIVPAWIMKYYILDLSPENSLIRFLVAQGFTVFAISWCNPSARQAYLSLDDYRKRGVMEAVDAISAIVPGERIHATGYCLGGTILSIAAATMARDNDERLASVSLFAAQVDFSEAGELLLFLDESQVAFLEDMMWAQGYLDRPQMSRTFASIRAEDLIYARAVRRYFLGKQDLPSDLTVWNNDTTRMPARMHGEYLRGLFLENRLTAGRFAVEGKVIALKDISCPLFVVGTEDDHIAPWRSVYKIRLFTDGDLTFVLTKGGHNGGILSEPGHPRRHYRKGDRREGDKYVDPDSWLQRHDPTDGSWWLEWVDWLQTRSTTGRVPPPPMGRDETPFAAIADAPGSYVLQK